MVVRKEQEENFLLEVLGFKGVKILGEELASKARAGLSQYHRVEADEVILVRVGQRVKEVREVFQLVRDIDHHVLDVVGFTVESVGDQGRYFFFTVVSRGI